MDRRSLPAADISSIFRTVSKTEFNPVMLWSGSSSGWKRLIAFGPVDSYNYYCGTGGNELSRFVEKNTGRLLTGYVSYDLGMELMDVPSRHPRTDFPDVCFYAYDNWLEFSDAEMIVHSADEEYSRHIESLIRNNDSELNFEALPHFEPKIAQQHYRKNFLHIIDHILNGNIYQANYTHQLQGVSEADPVEIFLHLLKNNQADFAAFIPTKAGNVMSLSPERFIRIKDRKIITEPIKGTRPRSESEDSKMKQELLNSEKEAAELFMITDLLRNDLGKICEIGSVKVTEKKGVQKLPAVWHTFSTIEGELKSAVSPIDALLSMSPGGSITGCPKKRALEVIDELEDQRRGVYTGSVGVIYPNGDLDMNIAIRTVVQTGVNYSLGVGGGITLGSNENEEYDETMAKAKSFREKENGEREKRRSGERESGDW